MLAIWTLVSTGPAADHADRNLIERLARGDGEALGEIYDRHGRRVYSLVLRIVRDQGDAEELVQEVFAQAWQQCARYAPSRGSVAAWLLTMARSRAIDRLRFDHRQKRTNSLHDDWRQPTSPRDSEDAVAFRERREQLRKALLILTADERHAVETAFFGELTYADAATQLNVPLGTVKTRIRSALLKLRQALAVGAQT